LVHHEPDVSEVLEGGVEEIEHEDGDRGGVLGVAAVDWIDNVDFGRFEGEDALRNLVVGDSEVVFGEPLYDWTALFVEHGDVKKNEA
jgi:hypothetical protein